MTQLEEIDRVVEDVKKFVPAYGWEAFFKDEVLRFHSVAGTIVLNFKNVSTSIDERILTHILIRSLIENYFRLLYVFDDSSQSSNRYSECLEGFKNQYLKLYNEPLLPDKSKLEPPDASWSASKASRDLNSMITAVMNVHGNRLSYLYFVYRIASFDTHGNSLESFFASAFKKSNCNFPVLNVLQVIELIADEYIRIWAGLIT